MSQDLLQLLLVEDREEDRFLLKRYFKRCQHSARIGPIDEAASMEQAIQALQQKTYDCVLLDLGLPDGAGAASIKRLLALYPGLKIIVLTGVDDKKTEQSALQYGATGYQVKRVFGRDDPLIDKLLQACDDNTAQPSQAGAADISGYTENKDGSILSWSPNARQILGFKNEEILGQSASLFIPKDRLGDIQVLRQRALGGEELHGIEMSLHHQDGSPRHLRMNCQGNAQTGILHWGLEDVTRAKASQHDSELLGAIVRSTADAVIAHDLDERIILWNHGAERMLGFSSREMLGRNLQELTPADLASEATQLSQQLRRGHTALNMATQRMTKDGRRLDVSITLSPLRDEHGGLIGGTAIYRDISAQVADARQLEQLNQQLQQQMQQLKNAHVQLLEQEKLASLGEMVAGMTHEVATPLGVGLTAASTLQAQTRQLNDNLAADELTRSGLERFCENATEAARLVQHNLTRAAELMHAFKMVSVDQASQEVRQFDLLDYLQQVLLSLRPKLKHLPHRIEIAGPDELELNSIPGAWSQIITNLVMNACIHGLSDDTPGKILIRIEHDEDRVRLEHCDNGQGIAPDILPRIWDRFFTTRRNAGGSGIGLDVVKALTQRLGGEITVSSTVGEGTCFMIDAPVQLPES